MALHNPAEDRKRAKRLRKVTKGVKKSLKGLKKAKRKR